jgi:hypothetical protein
MSFAGDSAKFSGIAQFGLSTHQGTLKFAGKTYNRERQVTVSSALTLANGDNYIPLPLGLFKEVRVYLSDTTNISAVKMAQYGYASGALLSTSPVLGWSVLNSSVGYNRPYNDPRQTRSFVIITTNGTPAATTATVEVRYYDIPGATDSYNVPERNPGNVVLKHH